MKKLTFLAIMAILAVVANAQALTPPVTLTIDSDEAFGQWTQINNNAAGNSFKYDSYYGGAYLSENRWDEANDWLIAPAFELTAGTEYSIVLNCRRSSSFSGDYNKFTINLGGEPTAEGLSTEVYKNENFTNNSFTDVKVVFTPETSGTYYIGIHVYSVAYKGGFVIKSLAVDKVVPRPGAVTDLVVKAAAEGALQADLTWTWPAKNDLGTALETITGAYIYRGTTSSFTANDASLVGTYEVDATPGTEGSWTDESVPSAGKYYYRVVPFNENGVSTVASTSVQSDWIGFDTSAGSVKDLVATISPESETTVLLNFAPAVGTNGGYLNPETLKYKITRKSGAGTTVTLEDAWAGELPYVDNTIPGLDSYTYSVYTVYNGSTSWSSTTSNTVVTGGTAALPYSQDFTASNSAELYTFFHGPDATRDWSRSSNALNYWGSPADAWAVTPKFHLEKGKAYELQFDAKISSAISSSSYKHLYVYVGTEPTAEALDHQVFYEEIQKALYNTKKVIISVDEDGDYCIGFRCYGPSNSNDLYVTNIKFDETVVTPKPVTEASAEAAPEGELKAIVKWTNPATDTAGGEIGMLDHVDVLLNNEVVATVEDTEGGAEASAEVAVEAAGKYTFTIVPYLGENAGDKVSVETGWVGPDTPKAPASVSVEVTDAARIITFDAVTEGINGGYVNPAEVTYTVTRNGDVLTDELKETTYTDDDTELPLGNYTYAVSAAWDGLESAATAAEPVKLGDALALPYTPSFDSKGDFELWSSSKKSNGTDAWAWASSSYSGTGLQTSTSNSWAFTPPLTMQEGTVTVKYAARAYSWRYAETFSVMLTRADDPENPDTVESAEPVTVDSTYPESFEATFNVPATGKYYVAYNLPSSAMTLTLTKSDVEQTTVITGVEDIMINPADGDATFYNLNGVKIEGDNIVPGLYIVVKDNKASKVVIK